MGIGETTSKVEEVIDEIIRKTRNYIAPVGRIFFLLTFCYDALVLVSNFANHTSFEHSIFIGSFSILIRLYCIFAQSIAPFMIVRRKWVNESCIALFAVILMEVFDLEVLRNHRVAAKTITTAGGLLMLLAEVNHQPKNVYEASLPKLDNDDLELGAAIALGRAYCIFVTGTVCHFNNHLSFKMISQLVATISLTIPLIVGYKTRKMAFVLAVWLIFVYFVNNIFCWELDYTGKDFRVYDFFQTISAIGSLLVLMHSGPGDLSVDNHLKKW